MSSPWGSQGTRICVALHRCPGAPAIESASPGGFNWVLLTALLRCGVAFASQTQLEAQGAGSRPWAGAATGVSPAGGHRLDRVEACRHAGVMVTWGVA